jgi:hypothetical protein
MSNAHLHPRTYTFTDLVSVSGATKSNITHWAREGVIQPVVQQTSGTGHHRKFGFRNIVEARLAQHLNRAAIPVSLMALLMEQVRFIDEASLLDRRVGEMLGRATKRSPHLLVDEENSEDLWLRSREWRLLKTPAVRPEYADFYGLSISLVDWSLTTITVLKDEVFDLRGLAEAAILIDMGRLLSSIEATTSDHWPGCLTADEVRELFAKVGRR